MDRVFKYKMSGQQSKFAQTPEALVPMLTADIDLLPELRANLVSVVKQIDSPWLISYLKYDPAADIRKVECPVMLLIGDNDKQVNSAINFQAAETLFSKTVRAKSLFKTYSKLNHFFQPSESGSPLDYAKIETTISEEVLSDIGDWISEAAK